MPDKYFLSASGTFVSGADLMTSVHGERVLWSGHCAVAEYAFDEPASLPRWTLAEETEVVVTEKRVVYANFAGQAVGELRWHWPQHLRVQPGNRDTGRSATVTQIQLVCAGSGGSFPALVFAGGDLTAVGDADRLANVLRQAISRFRVEHAAELGLTMPQSRMLSRLVIAPEFSNYQGGEGQTVTLLGSVPVQPRAGDAPTHEVAVYAAAPAEVEYTYGEPVHSDPAPPYADPVTPYGVDEPFLDEYVASDTGWVSAAPVAGYHADSPISTGTGYAPIQAGTEYVSAASHPEPVPVTPDAVDWLPSGRPGRDADATRARQAQRAAQTDQPDLASRAADLAARVASLVSGGERLDEPLARYETETTNLSAFLGPEASGDGPAVEQERPERAEMVRRTAARFAGNSARARNASGRRAEDEIGVVSRGGTYRNG
jgi:hypothetical protein